MLPCLTTRVPYKIQRNLIHYALLSEYSTCSINKHPSTVIEGVNQLVCKVSVFFPNEESFMIAKVIYKRFLTLHLSLYSIFINTYSYLYIAISCYKTENHNLMKYNFISSNNFVFLSI